MQTTFNGEEWPGGWEESTVSSRGYKIVVWSYAEHAFFSASWDGRLYHVVHHVNPRSYDRYAVGTAPSSHEVHAMCVECILRNGR